MLAEARSASARTCIDEEGSTVASLVIQLAGVIAVIIAAGFALAIFSLSLPPAEEKSREATPHSAPGKAAAHVPPPRERAHVHRTAAETTHTKEGKSQNEQNE